MKERYAHICEIPLTIRAYFHQNLERISRPPFEHENEHERVQLELAGDPGPRIRW